ncbi:hypothetical protein HPP92_003800 [Vanilla planifolia]|uniref:N-acyl-aliphatic-L-amino acid amidohydrolase n=1 Tax=Vanilla planifolia TaxID=51239 RepID=A0A835S6Y1_VANPL|nr:hypothetical protein HPP92_003800 [Vanilla planifolia]
MAAGGSLLLLVLFSIAVAAVGFLSEEEEAQVEHFQQYLRICTSHPNPDYAGAVSFLSALASSIGLETLTFEFTPGKPLLLLSWLGSDPSLPSLLLNSHLDSVPADSSSWVHPPYAAYRDTEGRIFARGAQDDKSIAIQYIEAIRKLKARGFSPLRTIHVSLVPDEEIGGLDGHAKFVSSEEFRVLNVGFMLDEGQASPTDEFRVFYADRLPWSLIVNVEGAPGHGSKMYDGSAMEHLMECLEAVARFRDSQFDQVKAGIKAQSEVISINLVYLKAGILTPTGFVMNLQPSEAEVGFDLRLPPTENVDVLRKRIEEEWAPTSSNMSYKLTQKGPYRDIAERPLVTPTNESNPWWSVFKQAISNSGGKLGKPEILTSTTDARFLRQMGIPVLGFSPMANTPILLHDHNEFLKDTVFLNGIKVYESVISAVHRVQTEEQRFSLGFLSPGREERAYERREDTSLGDWKLKMGRKGVPEWLNSSLWSSKPYSNYLSINALETLRPDSPPRPSSTPSPSPSWSEVPPSESSSISTDPGPPRFSPEEIAHQSQIVNELSKRVINVGELRRLVCQGIPDGGRIRPTIWKLLLHYLPNGRALWAHELEKKRLQYQSFKVELLQNPSDISRRMIDKAHAISGESNSEAKGLLQRSAITDDDHPLSLLPTSVWNRFFQEAELIEQIDRDVKRTFPDMEFFSGDSCYAKSNQESLRRILIVFAKLNPEIRYVQGMNEVLAPLFYVFRNDPQEINAAHVEADTFFCFVELLSEFRVNFYKQIDNSVVGIHCTIAKLSLLLKKHDEELWRHLEYTTKVNPQFYAFRWIRLLLAREFDFLDCLNIWDTILSDPEGPQETLLRICCAMLILVRQHLLAGDFTSNLTLLQHYPVTNIGHLLHVANMLRGTLL